MSSTKGAATTMITSISDILQSVENQYIEKIQAQADELDQLRAQITELQQHIDPYENLPIEDLDNMLDEIDQKEEKTNSNNDNDDEEKEEVEKTRQFWTNLTKKLKENDIDYIKDLIRSKELDMKESNYSGRNLLMLATDAGNYELVSMCINLGADIDKIDTSKKSALKIAKERGFPEIEELLLQNLLKTEMGERIENTTEDILKKKGLTVNFKQILNDLFNERDAEMKQESFSKGRAVTNTFLSAFEDIYKEEMLETMLRIILRSIKTKKSYSDDMLFIVFEYEMNKKGKKPVETNCFRMIKKVFMEILADTTNKKDWYWLKNYLLASSIWYFRTDPTDQKSDFLFYEVFKWVEEETKRQSAILSQPMRDIEQKNISEWNRLINFGVETNYDFDQVRQDTIIRGLKAEYTAEHLTQNVSLSGAFNPLTHYDLSQYLTKLILICHELDDQFHYDMQRIFDIDKATKQNKEMKLQYMRGPVKRLSRCNAKCLSDYREERFPTAAHVLDIIRCSLVFEDVSSMLKGMDRFIQKMKTKLYCILEVVRVKNGFLTDYKHETASYTDIKFNVMIKGKKYNVIGEVQFLFKKMFDYKKIAHSLYSIERTKEFVDDMSVVLPIKDNLEKQLFIHAARNNVNGLTDLMVTRNLTPTQLLKPNRQKQSILTGICDLNCEKVFSFLMKTVPLDMIKNALMTPEQNGRLFPLLRAIDANHFNGVLRQIFKNDKFGLIKTKDHRQKTALMHCWDQKKGKCALLILQNIRTSKDRMAEIESTGTDISSLQYTLKCGDLECVQFVLELMEGDKKLNNKLLSYKDSQTKNNFHYAAEGGSVECMKHLLEKCQTKLQRSYLFAPSKNQTTPLLQAMMHGKNECVEYILSKMNEHQRTKFFGTQPRSIRSEPLLYMLKQSSNEGNVATIKTLVGYLPKDDNLLSTVFLYAAKNDQIDLGKQVIAKTSDHLKQKVIDYQGPLQFWNLNCSMHLAVQQNNPTFLKWLLSIIDTKNPQFMIKNYHGKTPLMIAANGCYLRCAKLILQKVKENTKIKNELLSMKNSYDADSIQIVLSTNKKQKTAMARMMIKYYDENDFESVFLPCVQLGDLKLAQSIWDKTKNDKAMQQKLLAVKDKNKNNCFLLVCKNGAYDSLKWLLSLNDDEKDGDAEDEANLTQKKADKMSPILMCVTNDVRRELTDREVKSTKVLTDEEKGNYHKCVKLIFEKVSNKNDLILDADNRQTDVLMHTCSNGNEQTASFILSQINEKMKKTLIERVDYSRFSLFHHAVKGGSIKLAKTIYDLFQRYGKDKQLQSDSRIVQLALTLGNVEMSEWLIFTVIKDTKTAIKCLNDNILRAKKVRIFTEALKEWLNKLINSLKVIEDPGAITNIFNWIVDNVEDKNAAAAAQLVLSKIPSDDYSKGVFLKKTNCLSTACTKNRRNLLEQLLKFMGNFIAPLFENNAFYKAISSDNDECAEIILKSQRKQAIRDKILTAKTSQNETALDSAIKKKSKTAIDLILDNYSNIELLISDAFIKCLEQKEIKIAKYLLTKTKSKSEILNRKVNGGNSVLMLAVKDKKGDCLQFIVDELKNENSDGSDEEKEKTPEPSSTVHPMYLMKNNEESNIFHEMFKNECSMKNIKILQSVLSEEIIRNLLLQRNMNDELPIYCAFLKQGTEILEWILNQFDDPTEKYYLIAKRNKFHNTLLHKAGRSSSQMIEETKPFLAKVIFECLEQIDLNNLETVLLKDTFHYTITWKYSDLQKLILNKIPSDQYEKLLNRDGILHNDGQPVLHQIIEEDNVELCKLLLSKTKDVNDLMFTNDAHQNVLGHAISKGVGYECMKVILDKIYKKGKDFFLKIVTSRTNNDLSSSVLGLIYAKGDKEHERLILSYFTDWDKRLAVNAAIRFDTNFNHIPGILSTLDEKDKNIRKKMIQYVDEESNNFLQRSMQCDKRKVAEWILNDEIKEMDDPCLFVLDKSDLFPLFYVARYNDYADVVALVLSKLSPQNRLKQLTQKNYAGQCVLNRGRNELDVEKVMIDVLTEVIGSGDIIEDEEMMTDMFKFCLEGKMATKNGKILKLLLSKTTDEIKKKLFLKDNGWNVLRVTAKPDSKAIFKFFLNVIPKSQILDVIKDEQTNQNILHTLSKSNCDIDTFKAVLAKYDDDTGMDQNSYEELVRVGHEDKTMLFYAVSNVDIFIYVLQRMKTDKEKMEMFNRETSGYTTQTIFDVAKDTKVKDAMKTQIISILKNLKSNKLKPDDFINYFKWLCKENDLDSLKQLVTVFKKDKKFIYRLLDVKFGTTNQSPLQIACTSNNTELLEYFLSFIDKKNAHLLTYVDDDNRSAIYECFEKTKTDHLKIILSKLKALGSNELSDILLKKKASGWGASDCVGTEINKNKTDCTKLILESGFHLSVPVISSIFLAALKKDKIEFIEKNILSKLRQLKVSKKALFNYFDKDGNNALFKSLEKGNSKFVQIILAEIDKADDKAIANFVNLRNNKGQSLMHVAAQSTNLNCAKALVTMCEYFLNEKIFLLLAVDYDGNNALHTYLNKISSSKTSEIEDFVTFYLSNIKKLSVKLKFITQSNNRHVIPLDVYSLRGSKFGCALIERILKKINFATEENIESWSKLLRLSIKCSYNSSSIRQLIFDKYPNDKIKLLSFTDEKFQNSLYLAAMKSKQTLHDMLKYVDKDNAHLLLQPSYCVSKDGQTILHKLADTERLTMILNQFESPMDVISLRDDRNQSILSLRQTCNLGMILNQQYLNDTQICQMFMDKMGEPVGLYRYIEDHRKEIIPKLIWCRESREKLNLLMIILKNGSQRRYMYDLMWPFIEKLSASDKKKLLTQTTTTGQTILHYATATVYAPPKHMFEALFALYPDQKSIENALLERDNFGMTPFMNTTSGYSKETLIRIIWNKPSSLENKLKMIHPNSTKSFNLTTTVRKLVITDLTKMPKDAKISDVALLLPLFECMASAGDNESAQMVISKIDTKNKESVMKFLTTKIWKKGEQVCGNTVFHIAARFVKKEDPFLLQLLFDLMSKAGIDSQRILLNEEVMCNKQRLTPLTIVVKAKKPKIAEFILSKFQIYSKNKDANDRMKFIEIESIYHNPKTRKNYKNKSYVLRYNVIDKALESDNIDLLKVLLKDYGKKDIKRIMENKNGKIYLSMRQKSFNYLHDSFKLKSGFKQFSAKYHDGFTPFIEWAKHTNPKFIEKILSLCKNDDERVKLIYQCNDEGDNALTLANAKNRTFLTKWIKNMISSMKKIKSLDVHIPIFLYALRFEKIDLAKWLISSLSITANKRKLINCRNSFGSNSVYVACEYGKYESLKFLLDHSLFDRQLLSAEDSKGQTAIHYCYKGSLSLSCFQRILSCYRQRYGEDVMEKENLMVLKDKDGLYPLHFALSRSNTIDSQLVNWTIMHSVDYIHDKTERNAFFMRLLFSDGNKDRPKNVVTPTLCEYKQHHSLKILRCIKRYFDGIKQLDDESLMFAAHSLFWLVDNNWTLTKSIIAKCVDKEQRDKLINFKNGDNETVLHRIIGDVQISAERAQIIDWYLTEVISDDHPMLFAQDSINGKTILMLLVESGCIHLAQKLLDKVNKQKKSKLIQMEDNDKMNILDFAKQHGLVSVDKWIQQQMAQCL